VNGKCIRINILLFSLLSIVIIFSGCGDKEIQSKWRTQNIIIDGNDSDWTNSLVYYDDIKSLIGVQNDHDYLYLCLVTSDQQLERKILTKGLTIWFDNEDKGDKKFGIRYPLMSKGMNNDAFQGNEDNGEVRGLTPDDGREGSNDNGQAMGNSGLGTAGDKFLKNQTDIEVIDAHNETTRYPVSQLKGVQLKMTVKDYRMVYEFKIPIAMKNEYSYAVGSIPGNTISVGIEAGNPGVNKNKQFQDRGSTEGGDNPATGSGEGMGGGENSGDEGGGGHRGRGHGGENSGVNGSPNQDLKFWADIVLNTGTK